MIQQFPLLPLRDVVAFPGVVAPLFVGRETSMKAVEAAQRGDMKIVLVTQKNADVDDPALEDLYETGVVADIVQVMMLPDDTVKLLASGTHRVRLSEVSDDAVFCQAEIMPNPELLDDDKATVLREMLEKSFTSYIESRRKNAEEIIDSLAEETRFSLFVDRMVSFLDVSIAEKMDILSVVEPDLRAESVYVLISKELTNQDLEQVIRTRVKTQMDKNQKEYYLNEQAKAIQKELETIEGHKGELSGLEESLAMSGMPEDAKAKCDNELEKLKKMSAMSAEAAVIRTYLESMIDYPWAKARALETDLISAQALLNASHYGLDDVKDRIVEHIAVQLRTKQTGGSIICLVGPPGVGKTSLGKTIAEALSRDYVRLPLGGVRDEAEIRGHRRTYIGAMPGKIVQKLTQVGVNNPLFLLDEIDKMGMDHRGDPASAMLEVLDPEQNKAFSDHYLEVDVDLSNVMFVATANTLDIPEPLKDRMEIIRIPGYTELEKLEIGKRYLLPRNLSKTGLQSEEVSVADSAIQSIVEHYTREAGVRNLDKEISKLCRKVLTEISLTDMNDTEAATGAPAKPILVNGNNLEHYLGPKKFVRTRLANKDAVGRVSGLAWTEVGGELLDIEVSILPGKGKLQHTGKLGDVMKESVNAAMTVARAKALSLGVDKTFFENNDIHMHLPEGAVPKDGPSAGIAMATALLSAIVKAPISNQFAMTGELTLHGNVLRIGGLREKLFAAKREGIKNVLIPEENVRDLVDVAEEIKKHIHIQSVATIEDVYERIFPSNFKDYILSVGAEIVPESRQIKSLPPSAAH